MPKPLASPSLRRIALLVEASRAYARGLVRGVAQYNRQRKQWSIYFTPQDPYDALPAWLESWRGDGILARIDNRRMAEAILATGLPVVELRRSLPDLGLPTIGPDDTAVAGTAAGHLMERGFRSFGFCAAPPGEHPSMDSRAECFRQTVGEAGFPCSTFHLRRRRRSGGGWEHDEARLAQWIAGLPKPAGVMACNDDRGLLVLDACRRAGAMVPDEVAVIGAGNDDCLCNLALPPLSSVDLNPQRIGYEAAELLDRLMDGEAPARQDTLVGPRGIVTRMSTDVLATDDQGVVRAVRFIRQHACDRIRVGDVLRDAKMSRAALEPRMKRILGRTIHQEIQRVQIERVKELLVTTDVPLKQIASQTGFRYVEYMMRVFHRRTGQTMTGYRKRTR